MARKAVDDTDCKTYDGHGGATVCKTSIGDGNGPVKEVVIGSEVKLERVA